MKEMKPQYAAFELAIKLKKLMKKIERVQADVECGGITYAQERIIFPIIRDEKGYTIQELAEAGGVAKSLVSRVVADLVAGGYLKRDKKSESQDRNYKIILTDKGRAFVEKKNARVLEVTTRWFSGIEPEFLYKFNAMVDAMLDMPKENK
jgi:DNA-binding MarR family transcriptional regulator